MSNEAKKQKKTDWRAYAMKRLSYLHEVISEEIDGGEECRGRDEKLSHWTSEIKKVMGALAVMQPATSEKKLEQQS